MGMPAWRKEGGCSGYAVTSGHAWAAANGRNATGGALRNGGLQADAGIDLLHGYAWRGEHGGREEHSPTLCGRCLAFNNLIKLSVRREGLSSISTIFGWRCW